MVGMKTGFMPGYDLFFTLRTEQILYRFYSVKSQREFFKMIGSWEVFGGKGWEYQDYIDMLYHALIAENPKIKKEDIEDLLDTWQLENTKGAQDVYFLIFDTFANSGMYSKNMLEAVKKNNEVSEDKVNEILEAMLKTRAGIKEVIPEQGEDTGEAKKT